jgi:6-phosphogluconate dehydrogenase
MKLGMVGLGRMGGNMTERLRRDGHEVETYARTAPERTADSLVELATQLEQPRVVWLMIPAGNPTENAFQTLLPLLEDGDTIVDGGNSNFRDSQRRAAEAKAKGVYFLDAGVSGGIWGLENGYCIMVGGEEPAFEAAEPIFKTIAGIWRYGSVVRSWLLELLYAAFEQEGNELEKIAGYVEDSGEGRWTVFEAINESVPAPVIAASLFARFGSRQDESFGAKINAALRKQFGGHAVKAE